MAGQVDRFLLVAKYKPLPSPRGLPMSVPSDQMQMIYQGLPSVRRRKAKSVEDGIRLFQCCRALQELLQQRYQIDITRARASFDRIGVHASNYLAGPDASPVILSLGDSGVFAVMLSSLLWSYFLITSYSRSKSCLKSLSRKCAACSF